jgi:nicotinate-nucleotide adenylyltransferase
VSVALLGTSADPPTWGHQALLEGLLAHFPRVATWASDNPLKQHGAPLEQRAALLAALVQAIGDPRLELVQELSSPWAITTLRRAAQRWPQEELVFVVGSDLASQIPGWREAEAVLRSCRLLDPAAMEQLQHLGAQVQTLPLQVPATASSTIRQQPGPDQVPAAVWTALLEHNLYGLATRP